MTASPSVVIFGASGDLAWRKLVPALYNLFRKESLPEDFRIVGFARSDFSRDEFRDRMREGLEQFADFKEDAWESFASNLYYVQGQYGEEESLAHLRAELEKLEPDGAGRLYYLAVPPTVYAPIVECLGAAGMVSGGANAEAYPGR